MVEEVVSSVETAQFEVIELRASLRLIQCKGGVRLPPIASCKRRAALALWWRSSFCIYESLCVLECLCGSCVVVCACVLSSHGLCVNCVYLSVCAASKPFMCRRI